MTPFSDISKPERVIRTGVIVFWDDLTERNGNCYIEEGVLTAYQNKNQS